MAKQEVVKLPSDGDEQKARILRMPTVLRITAILHRRVILEGQTSEPLGLQAPEHISRFCPKNQRNNQRINQHGYSSIMMEDVTCFSCGYHQISIATGRRNFQPTVAHSPSGHRATAHSPSDHCHITPSCNFGRADKRAIGTSSGESGQLDSENSRGTA
ncbi:hypothetical protein F2Q68_00039864 [Brassica cretica]|uniref:Uncharacterized protein n=1 Tax=Brassica cretica TaxID=69181 RepID=A0A8S9MQW3_BRACR|nr:hypothetical protein F2Q68_00039864 [Brassica cretica]